MGDFKEWDAGNDDYFDAALWSDYSTGEPATSPPGPDDTAVIIDLISDGVAGIAQNVTVTADGTVDVGSISIDSANLKITGAAIGDFELLAYISADNVYGPAANLSVTGNLTGDVTVEGNPVTTNSAAVILGDADGWASVAYGTITIDGGFTVEPDVEAQIYTGGQLSVGGAFTLKDGSSLFIEGAGAQLDTHGTIVIGDDSPALTQVIVVEGSWDTHGAAVIVGDNANSLGSLEYGAAQLDASALIVGDEGDGTATFSDSEVSITGDARVGGLDPTSNGGGVHSWSYSGGVGTLEVDDDASLIISGNLTLKDKGDALPSFNPDLGDAGPVFDDGGISITSGGSIEVGGRVAAPANTLQIAQGGALVGHGEITGEVTGELPISETTATPTFSLSINNEGKIEADDGLLALNGDVSGSGQFLVGDNSTLAFGGKVDDDVTVMFLPGDDETIVIDDPNQFDGVISSENFTPGDKIDLANVPYINPGSADLNPDGASFVFDSGDQQTNDTLQIIEDDQTYNISIGDDDETPLSGGFTLSDDGQGGTLVTYTDDAVTGYSVEASVDGPTYKPYASVVQVDALSPKIDPENPTKAHGLPFIEGTGFVVGPGLVLTAFHNIENPGNIEVRTLGGNFRAASVIAEGSHNGFGPLSQTDDWAYLAVPGLDVPYSEQFQFYPGNFSSGKVNFTGYPFKLDGKVVNNLSVMTQVDHLEYVTKLGVYLTAAYDPGHGASGGPLWVKPTPQSPMYAVGLVSGFLGVGSLKYGYNLATSEIPQYSTVGVFPPPFYKPSSGIGVTTAAASPIEPLGVSSSDAGPAIASSSGAGAAIASATIVHSGDARDGTTVPIYVILNENVIVTGAPTLTLNDGGVATYNAAESTGTELIFDYTVGAGDQTTDLEITGATGTDSVQAPGGASVDFSVLDDQPTNLSINSPLTVTSVAASQTGEVGAGATVQLTLTMSEAVSVDVAGGAPSLDLDDGATATYDAAASNPADGKLVFDYTAGADDATPNLEISSVLIPTGTTITDAAGYNADFSAADDAPTGLQVGAAFLTAITPSQTGDVTTGQTLALTLTLSQGVTVSGGSPTLSLSDGADATYDAAASNPSAGTLVFDYTVGADDYTTDLQILGYSANGATISDAHGVAANLSGAADDELALDVNAAVVTGVSASPSTGEANSGQEVKLTLTMNEAVVVNTAGGSPTLTLDDAATATYDAAASDPSAGTLVFDYAVGASDQTPNLQVADVNLNGATIDDAHGHAADFSAADDFATGLQIGAAFVGGVTPSLTGDIFTGQTDQIVLTISQAVTVDTADGSPTLSLSDGATATYDAAASDPADDTMAFDYTVGASDYTTDLQIDGYNANGAIVTDANGVAANFADVSQDDLYSDVNATVVTDVAASAPSGEADSGAEVAVTLTMSGAVTVDTANGSPTLSVGDGWTATYDSAASDLADGTLVFDYTVAAGDETPDLSVIQAYLNGATIDDANGHAVDLSAVSNFNTGLQIGPAYVDQVAPSVSGDVATGQTVQFDVALSAPVTVDTAGGSPTLSLSDGEVASYDAAASSPAADELVFDYTVAAGDYAKNLAITGIDLDGATVEDANGVGVDFAGLTSSDLGLDVNATTVVALAASPSTGAALPGQQVVLTLTLSGPVTVNTTAGSPNLYLSDGAVAAYDAAASDPSSGTLAFSFTDASGDYTPDLAIVQVNLQGAVITDAHGNAPDLSAALGVKSGLEVSAACYVRGARIATPNGYVAIEDLRVGDLALTASGAARPIRWIGQRRLDLARHPRPAEVRPVRVARGAFGDGLPLRDLWLSPGHNIAWDGALMPISALINGVSVQQIERDSVEYWHVELDAHDVILAEGLPAESYLDTGNRTAFANGGAFVEAHPDFKPRHWADTCLPLALDGPAVFATKARLLGQLAQTGCELTTDADAHVRIDGLRVEPIRLSETRLVFVLPPRGRELLLRSRTFVPAQTIAQSDDLRTLGLCIGALQIDGSPVTLSDKDECGLGWHTAEYGAAGSFSHRWTTGSTNLPPGARVAIIDLAGKGQYWRERRTTSSCCLPEIHSA